LLPAKNENGASEKKIANPNTHDLRRMRRRAAHNERASSRLAAGRGVPNTGVFMTRCSSLGLLRVAFEVFVNRRPGVGAAFVGGVQWKQVVDYILCYVHRFYTVLG
jgi:hypothetical protein